jgi:phosphopantetheinyl transferase (holo-ACP synthase)
MNPDEEFMPFVFSGEERNHFNTQNNPAKAFCAAFCAKEAFFKSISEPYNFNECEFFYSDNNSRQELKVNDRLKTRYGIVSAEVIVEFVEYPAYTECVAAVYLLQEKRN